MPAILVAARAGGMDEEQLVATDEDLGDLDRAIAAFHMEAIRFRMFTLGRLLSDPSLQVPEQAKALFDGIRHSLEEAGFQTRSITH